MIRWVLLTLSLVVSPQLIGDVMGFVEDLISFLTCGGMGSTECPKVNEWSILSGPGSKGGKSNISSMIG